MNTTEPWIDPVVAEIHATRERLAAQYQNDMQAYSEVALARCRALGLNMVAGQGKQQAGAPGLHVPA